MKKFIIYLFALSLCCSLYGQPNDSVFKGGLSALYRHFSNNMLYPDKTKVGTTILAWSVENGEIRDAKILNSLGSSFDEDLMRVLEMTKSGWISTDSIIQFRLPIVYMSNSFAFYVDKPPASYLDQVVMVSYGTNPQESDDALISKLNSHLADKNYDKAIEPLDEIISRNPFNLKIRLVRIFCNQQLNKQESACLDIDFLLKEMNTVSKYSCQTD